MDTLPHPRRLRKRRVHFIRPGALRLACGIVLDATLHRATRILSEATLAAQQRASKAHRWLELALLNRD